MTIFSYASVQAEAVPTHALTFERPTILTALPPRCTASSDASANQEEDEEADSREPEYTVRPAQSAQAQCESFKELKLAPVEGSRFRYWPPAPDAVDTMFRSSSASSDPGSVTGAAIAEDQSETSEDQPAQPLIALCERNRFGRSLCGLQDRAGQLLVPLKFDEARPNPDSDLQAVRFDNRWGYFSISQQRLIVVPQFVKVGDVTQGSAFVETSDEPTRTWLIDENGNRIKELPMGARISGDYEDGLSLLRFDERYGYIDERGNVVISAQFVNASPFKNGLAFVQYNAEPDQYALIDRNGEGQLFFQFPDTRLLPLGQQQYLALSGCNNRNGCLARCLSLGENEALNAQVLSSKAPVALEVTCLVQEEQQALSD
ncbi:hypothetical protein GCM10022278_08850 [Allohahella marinimesophila]|uniref:WG repeat protein n=2 Tax=Allohahella marinimesophila TaxID=1054972 RepID=A0ABP7NQQ0_9GAMM